MPDLAFNPLQNIIQSHERKKQLGQVDNNSLATRILEKVWAHSELFSEENDLIAEAIDRLKRIKHSPGVPP